MKQLLFCLLLVMSVNVLAQDTSYSKIYEPVVGPLSYNLPISDAAIVWDDGLITSGFVESGAHPTFLARLSPDGSLMWQKAFSDNGIPDSRISFNQVISTRDSNFVAVGVYKDLPSYESRAYCMKLNEMGDTLWTRSFFLSNQTTGSFQDVLEDNGKLIETKDSALLVGFHHSSFTQSSASPDHLCLSKYKMNGDVAWSKSFISDSSFYLREMVQAADSSFYIVGQSGEDGNYSNLINLSSDGQLNWVKKYEGIQFEDIELDSNYLYVSWMYDNRETGIVKLDLNGNHITRVRYRSSNVEIRGVRSTKKSNGNIVSAPMEYLYAFPERFVELNEDLVGVHDIEAFMFMNEVVSIPEKGFYAIGYGPLQGIKAGYVEMGVIRFDSLMSPVNCANSIPLSVTLLDSVPSYSVVLLESDSLSFVTANLAVVNIDFVSEDDCVTFLGSVDELEGSWNETVSPNPSNGEFTIDWNEYRDVEMIIYNSIGMEVYRTSVKGSFLEIDLRDEHNGMYYYRLTDRGGNQSRGKLMLTE